MADTPSRAYLKALYTATNYWGSWLPGKATAVGDSGPLDGVVFKNQAKLDDYNVTYSAAPSGQFWQSLEAKSSDGVSITPRLSATTLIGPQSVTVSFTRANRMLFGASNVSDTQMLNPGSVSKQLLDLVRSGAFPADYVVATEVLEAAQLTALVSQGSNQKVNLTVTVPVPNTPIGPALLAGAIEAALTADAAIKVVGGQRMTPLFKLMRPPKRPPDGFWEGTNEAVRDRIRDLFAGPAPPRLPYLKATADLGAGVSVGGKIQIQPDRGQRISISAVSGETLDFATEDWSPFTVEPLVVGDVHDFLSGGAGWSFPKSDETWPSAVELTTGGWSAGGEVNVRLPEASPIIIEQPSGDLMIARPLEPVKVTMSSKDLPNVPAVPTAPVEYVDFDEVYAATEQPS